MRRGIVAATASLALALPLAACSGDGGRDDTFVLQLDGAAEVRGDDGSTSLAAGRHRLQPGDQVRVTDGSATLGLPGESTVELRAGRRRRADSVLDVGVVPTLVDGYALLVAEGDDGRLRAGSATLTLRDGAARVRRSTGISVAVYEGEAAVSAHGNERAVPPLRQLSLSDATAIPRRAAPLVFDRDDVDPWDRRYLGAAIALGAQLDRMSAAVSRQVSTSPRTGEELRAVVPALATEPGLGRVRVAANRTVGETVVGASIAARAEGEFADRWDEVFDFREQGADWGLVALDQRADRAAVVDVLDGVLDAAVEGPVLVAGPAPVDLTGATARPAPGPTTGPPPSTPAPTSPPGGEPEEPAEEPPAPPDPVEPTLLEPIEGLLGPTADATAPLLGTVTETVGGLLGG